MLNRQSKKKSNFIIFTRYRERKVDHFVPEPSVEGKTQRGEYAMKITFFDAFWPNMQYYKKTG